MYKEIDDIAMEIWGEEGTLGDLFSVLTSEQTEFLMNMSIKDFVGDPDELSFGLELVVT